MKYIEFKKQLDEDIEYPVYLFEGEDAFFRERGFSLLKNKFVSNQELNFVVLEKVDFNNEKCLLNNGYLSGTLLTIGVSFAGLLVNAKTKKVTTVSGLLPKSIWYRKKLTAPSALKGEVTVNHKDVSNYTIMKCLKDESSFYDSKSGWLCIGNRKLVKNTTNVQIMENVILVFENNELKSLWINLGVNL